MSIGSVLKYHRLRYNLTCEQVAEKVHKTADTIRCWERDARIPRPCDIIKICNTFRITPNQLFEYDK